MEDLRQYLCKNAKDRLIMLVSSIIFGGIGIVLYFQKSYILFGIFLLLGLILLYQAIVAGSKDKKAFQKLIDSGEIPLAITEFASARDYANGKIKLGRSIIFRYKIVEFLHYADIATLTYRESTDENNARKGTLTITTRDGKDHFLCDIYGRNPHLDAKEIAEALREYNKEFATIGI